jgi:hypothetical protein
MTHVYRVLDLLVVLCCLNSTAFSQDVAARLDRAYLHDANVREQKKY